MRLRSAANNQATRRYEIIKSYLQLGSSSNRYAPRLPQQETKSSTKQLAPMDPILGPENLLKTGFAQKGLPSSPSVLRMATDHPYGSVLPTMAILDVTIVAGWTAVAPSVLGSGLLCYQSWISLLPPNTETKETKTQQRRRRGGTSHSARVVRYDRPVMSLSCWPPVFLEKTTN